METLAALLGLALGALAVFAAMRVRRELASRLGRAWRLRFLAVQGVLINATLYAVWRYLGNGLGYDAGPALWGATVLYAPVFFVYSLSNIDWTARKFHGEPVAGGELVSHETGGEA